MDSWSSKAKCCFKDNTIQLWLLYYDPLETFNEIYKSYKMKEIKRMVVRTRLSGAIVSRELLVGYGDDENFKITKTPLHGMKDEAVLRLWSSFRSVVCQAQRRKHLVQVLSAVFHFMHQPLWFLTDDGTMMRTTKSSLALMGFWSCLFLPFHRSHDDGVRCMRTVNHQPL